MHLRALGASLKAQRQRRGLTVEHLAQTTKISPSLVMALESGEHLRLPSGTLLTQWVASYAKATQLPVSDALAQLAEAMATAQRTDLATPGPEPLRRRRWSGAAGWALAAVLGLLLLLFSLRWSLQWVAAASAF